MQPNQMVMLLLAPLVAAGLLFSSFQARSEEPARALPVASPAVDATQQRAIVLPSVKAGGIRPGQITMITGYGVEVMSATRLAQQQPLTLKLSQSELCLTH